MSRALTAALVPLNVFGIGLAIFSATALFFFTPPARYVWASDNGNGGLAPACEPTILDRPIYSLTGLAAFATEAVLELNTYDYLTWDTRLTRNTRLYFTEAAGSIYAQQFRASNLLAQVQRDYYSVSGQTVRPPVVTQTRDNGLKRSWEVQVPVRIYYQTGARTADGPETIKSKTQTLVFMVQLVEQTPSQQNQRGIAINTLTFEQVQGTERLDQLRGIN